MLINDLKVYTQCRNYSSRFNGMDTPGESVRKDFTEYPVQDFYYEFNSWGFRGPDYAQYIGKPVNICLGDSFTVNIGGPVSHSWCSQLAEHYPIPTLNLGMDGAGNDALSLLYYRACDLFDVQFTFVMYSYLHRRLVDGTFRQDVYQNEENFDYFLEHRIPNAIECAVPGWCYTDEEKQFLSDTGIYVLDPLYFSEHKDLDRQFVSEEVYNTLRGPDWPTLEQFVDGAEPHADMFSKKFGQFISKTIYTNRDGHHLDQNSNKQYAEYLYKKWSANES